MLAAILIFVCTLVLVIWQPRGLGIGWSASLGAIVALALGVVHWADIAVVWGIVWNATATSGRCIARHALMHPQRPGERPIAGW